MALHASLPARAGGTLTVVSRASAFLLAATASSRSRHTTSTSKEAALQILRSLSPAGCTDAQCRQCRQSLTADEMADQKFGSRHSATHGTDKKLTYSHYLEHTAARDVGAAQRWT